MSSNITNKRCVATKECSFAHGQTDRNDRWRSAVSQLFVIAAVKRFTRSDADESNQLRSSKH